MPKLWIVHRHSHALAALVRLAGLAPDEIATGAPQESDFADQDIPTTIVMGLAQDFEVELDFAHRILSRALRSKQHPSRAPVQWILVADAADHPEVIRLFDLVKPSLLPTSPSMRSLRSEIEETLSRAGHPNVASLAERRSHQRIANRFSAWLGAVEVPGLLRALDPALGQLPLLVRGVPGSGRSLTARYLELFRTPSPAGAEGGDASIRLRLSAQDLEASSGPDVLPQRGHTARTGLRLWIDEIDALSLSAQHALAEQILMGDAPGSGAAGPVQWLATAGPARWNDPLEPELRRAFTPLIIEIPSLAEHPETVAPFAENIAQDWSRQVGGPPRQIHVQALEALAEQSWPGDRAELEAVIRGALASTTREEITLEDFDLGRRTERLRESDPDDEAAHGDVDPGAGAAASPDAFETEPFLETELEVVEAQPEPGEDFEGLLEEFEPVVDWERTAETPAFEESPDLDHSIQLSEASFQQANEANESWRRLAQSLAHEIRNPLVSIRTFAELLPDNHDDATFRERFVELVSRDVRHIDNVVGQMQSVAKQGGAASEAIDVSQLLEELLTERRPKIQNRRLLVLRELERDAPCAWAEGDALRAVLAGLLDRALDTLPERGDLFVATRHIARGSEGEARLRILLRYHSPELAGGTSELDDLSPAANVLEYVLAETVARASGGSFAIDSSDARETLILFDLKTPS